MLKNKIMKTLHGVIKNFQVNSFDTMLKYSLSGRDMNRCMEFLLHEKWKGKYWKFSLYISKFTLFKCAPKTGKMIDDDNQKGELFKNVRKGATVNLKHLKRKEEKGSTSNKFKKDAQIQNSRTEIKVPSDPLLYIQGLKIKVQIQESKNMEKEVQYEEILK
jgi:hypothetical protein